MVNWVIDPDILAPWRPRGTVLDLWQGRCYVSIVAFNFLDTRLKGVRVPFHVDFEEINLRFYVRRELPGESRRGVVFIKEIVPRAAIAIVARALYNENYVAMPTRHSLQLDGPAAERHARFEWRLDGAWQSVSVRPVGELQPLAPGSEAEYIAEHYWGYTAQRDGGTVEYEVTHPPWQAWAADDIRMDIDVAALYGPEFAATLAAPPSSAFLVDGSHVAVTHGERLTDDGAV